MATPESTAFAGEVRARRAHLPARPFRGATLRLPGDVTIIAIADKAATPGVYTWSITGAIRDSGRWIDGNYHWDALPSHIAGTLRNELTLVGAGGTIGIRFEGVLAPTVDREILTLEGSWQALEGTGAYARLRGGGNASVSFCFGKAAVVGRFTGRLGSD